MAQTGLISFSYKEVVEALIKKHGIHEGIWGMFLRFGIQGANLNTELQGLSAGEGSRNLLPAAIIPVLEIGLQKFDEVNSLSVDAAQVNPAPAEGAETSLELNER